MFAAFRRQEESEAAACLTAETARPKDIKESASFLPEPWQHSLSGPRPSLTASETGVHNSPWSLPELTQVMDGNCRPVAPLKETDLERP